MLALIQGFGGELPKTSFHKLLFLFTIKQVKPDYDFVPYKFGCYSFSANADLIAMIRHGQMSETSNYIKKLDSNNYIKLLNDSDKAILISLINKLKDKSIDYLLHLTYTNYKYYAINSEIAKDILPESTYNDILAIKPNSQETVLFTIGYEGVSLEVYLNKLIKNNINLLVDVRCNALSMKFGFSKKQLSSFCNNMGIEYIHVPEVGIQSDQRQQLNTQLDYDRLFEEYIDKTLPGTIDQQKKILQLLVKNKRIALTCFEANICQCHRKHLANAITNLQDWHFKIQHI